MSYGSEQVTTSRETRGIQIPDGTPYTIPAGTSVRIAQSLGDTYTLVLPWGQMVRIESRDADAIGKEPHESASNQGTAAATDDASLEEQVWGQLRTCYDPEIPVNIVDLGREGSHLVTCPWHEAHFDLRTGGVSQDTSWATDTRAFRVELRGDEVWVDL